MGWRQPTDGPDSALGRSLANIDATLKVCTDAQRASVGRAVDSICDIMDVLTGELGTGAEADALGEGIIAAILAFGLCYRPGHAFDGAIKKANQAMPFCPTLAAVAPRFNTLVKAQANAPKK